MCGIAGIVLKSNTEITDLRSSLKLMAHAMQHRGPDDEGIYLSPNGFLGLVNRRLAIRDISPAGHMPMENEAGDVVITYNGEIYNTDELRVELKNNGYVFQSSSDTEVILHGYEHWGNEVVSHLRGMFAFVICDARHSSADNPKILIARDQFGIKPLYFWQSSTMLVFASEIKTLLASGLINQEVDPAGLIGYLLTGSVPVPLTIYSDVQALEPSTYLFIEPSDTIHTRPTTYWTLPVEIEPISNSDEAVRNCLTMLAEAVRICLVSDVPLGAFLSGGLDSSSIVALMRRATNGTIRTCSMVFEEGEYSESHYARAVAKAFDTDHYERVVTSNDVLYEFDNILHALDQPSVDGLNMYFVSQTARQAGLTVALSGLGGDELFGGYKNTFQDVPWIRHMLKLVQQIPAGTTAMRAAITLMPNRARWGRIEDALEQPADLASAYIVRRGLFSLAEAKQLVSPDIWEVASSRLNIVQSVMSRVQTVARDNEDPFGWISRAELRNYTHNQLLRDTDVMSMKHSLEVRVPLLDIHLVTAVLKMPTWIKKLNGLQPKPLLAKAMRGLVPDIVLNRRDKVGFTFPLAIWLRNGLAAKVRQAVESTTDKGLISATAAAHVFSQFEQGRIHWSRVWALVALESISS